MRDWNSQLSILTALLLLADLAKAGPIYNVATIGNLGGQEIAAFAINGSGAVSGWGTNPAGDFRAFTAGSGAPSEPGLESRGGRLNSAGAVAMTVYSQDTSQAAVWADGVVTVLPGIGGAFASALDINDSSIIAGGATTAAGSGLAVLWQDGLPSVIGALPGGTWSSAYGINAQNQVVGYGDTAGGNFRGFLWDSAGGMRVLGTLGGASSYAMAINDSGWVAGHAAVASGYLHAFLFDGSRMIDLGALGAANSHAYGVNFSGHVVGYSDVGGSTLPHAFIYRDGVLTDLNDLIDAPGWELTEAYGINDAGQIAGSGYFNGERMAFRLDPKPPDQLLEPYHAPEPSTWILLGIGLLLIAGGVFKRPRRG